MTRTTGSGTWIAGSLVSLPELALSDPSNLVLTEGGLAEEHRYCECGAPVGRSYRGQPGLADGFCQCGRRFSFSLKLAKGDQVHDRYRVDGPLARGGFGWVYLARDLHLDRPVVLKGLINTQDRKARELAVNERIALTTLDHPNVVRIFDFVKHPDPVSGDPLDYIVMEHVGGPTLAELKVGSSWLSEHGRMTPEYVISYVLEILTALDYLHGVGLLYCDMKPGNAIRGTSRLKVIDLGAVRGIDDRDSVSVGTDGYRVSADEVAAHGYTVRSDLHTVGKTLEVLYQVTDEALADNRAGSRSVALRSLRLVYERAMADYHRRFASAKQMVDQLTGVLREIVALRGDAVPPMPSTVFDEQATLLDAGLGTAPSLLRWISGTPDVADVLAHGLPTPGAIAAGLAVPLVMADDPGAAFLATLSATNPAGTVTRIVTSGRASVEIHLRASRAAIAIDDLDGADKQLANARCLLDHPEFDWRIVWHRGLIALARGAVDAARAEFVEVYRDLPGEEAPKLALGLCAERVGDRAEAEAFYQAVWARNKQQAGAAFGLARISLARADRAAAVAVLAGVIDTSPHAEAARIAAITVLCGRLSDDGGLPSDADLTDAVARLGKLRSLDGGEREGPVRVRLTAMVREAALHRANSGPLSGVRGGVVLGEPATERGLRELMESSYRRLASQAQSRRDHDVLVDHANSVRPHTVW
ncbi:serine/threonine protein kinase [Alloactinosynnema sp. L-07]|uniref:serine/threonine-protein kinase n=1 Tax=Alloactinosynnema sp. L-07 TaxID=1653480 RepID=UPI00065EFA28|nr:serine/threonine-protein kinase [Alloactinosynnema sp. L-07]CRK56671.1 serine/threonine protein kinase [Alloactinosynnema sp. L-07]